MRSIANSLKSQLRKIKRHEHHPLVNRIHKSHKISHKTIFYMKEYGPESHVASVILKESLFALVIAFAFGVAGGVSLQVLESNLIFLLPLIILLPSLNDMVGDYSMIVVSRLSTLIFTKGALRNWWKSEDVHKIIRTIIIIALLSATYMGVASSFIAYMKGFSLTASSVIKVLQVSLFTTLVMTGVVIIISATSVFYVYKRKEDPNNLVMPIMTSVADLGTILVFALMVRLIF